MSRDARLRPGRGASLAGDLLRVTERVVDRFEARQWPSAKWALDPVGFMWLHLAFEAWDRQREMAELVRDNPRVAIASGHRIGKTDLIGALAIWFYCCFRDARAILLGPTADQIDRAAYRSVRKLWMASGICVDCYKKDPHAPRPCPHSALLTGTLGASSEHGVRSTNDQREIRGVNVRSPEAAQGIAGENILILADEASGEYFTKITGAMAGNRAGGAKLVAFGNPLGADGEFFDAFDRKRDFYVTRRISSEDSPNVKAGKIVIPGLATRDWVEEQLAEYGGRDSPFFKMRVLGQHVTVSDGQIYPPTLLELAVERWKVLRDIDSGSHLAAPAGSLVVSIDPAGDSGEGDSSVFMCRRGMDVLELYERIGLTPDAHVRGGIGLVDRYRHPAETATIVVDAAGDVGARVRGAFLAEQERRHSLGQLGAWELKLVQGGFRAERDENRYMTVRDEMCAALLDWLQSGGAIPDHAKLKYELSKFAWLKHVSGKAKATPKDGPGGLREKLGRSPGFADVLMLSTWARDASGVVIVRPPTAVTPAQALDQLQRGATPGAAPQGQPRPAPGWNPYQALSDFYRPPAGGRRR